MTDRRETHSFVVVWFPPDKPHREARRSSLEDALAYIREQGLARYAPMVEERHTVTTESSAIVWNSTDGDR